MRRITLQQIEELPDREKRQFIACCNHYLGSLYERMRRIDAAERNPDGNGNESPSEIPS